VGAATAEVLAWLESRADPRNVAGMARYGIRSVRALGVPGPELRAQARALAPDHDLALALWRSAVHDARVLAALVDDPARVTPAQMERWARDFDNWAVCDACCWHLFDRTPHAVAKARAWSTRREEFVRRAGFVLMAALALHDRQAKDALFADFLRLLERRAEDERSLMRKAVSWAVRQIGKRNPALHAVALATTGRLAARGTPGARWVATDARRELESAAVRTRLARLTPARS